MAPMQKIEEVKQPELACQHGSAARPAAIPHRAKGRVIFPRADAIREAAPDRGHRPPRTGWDRIV